MTDYVLATTNPPALWDFYPSLEAAQADYGRANCASILKPEGITYEPMTYEDYLAAERTFYLSDPLTEITESQWTYAHRVLPLEHACTREGMYLFCCLEHQHGPYTYQRAAVDGRYYQKIVDASDQTTWINRAMLEANGI